MKRIDYLATLIARQTQREGLQATVIPGLALSRYSSVRTPRKSLNKAVLCFVAQGSKTVLSAQQRWTYDRERFLIVCMDVPIVAQIAGATRTKPFLGVDLDLDFEEVREICNAVPCHL